MKSRTASRLSWSLAGVVLTLVAATWVLVLLNRDVIHNLEQARPIELVLPIGFAVIGALVASLQPGNTFIRYLRYGLRGGLTRSSRAPASQPNDLLGWLGRNHRKSHTRSHPVTAPALVTLWSQLGPSASVRGRSPAFAPGRHRR